MNTYIVGEELTVSSSSLLIQIQTSVMPSCVATAANLAFNTISDVFVVLQCNYTTKSIDT